MGGKLGAMIMEDKMSDGKMAGGCMCGAVRFEADYF